MKTINKRYFHDFINEINKMQVSYVILRNYHELPLVGNDIDFLVEPEHLHLAIQALKDTSKKYDVHLTQTLNKLGLVSYECIQNDELVQFDFFTKLIKKWIPYADSACILNNKVEFNGFYVPEKNHEVWLVTLKEVLTYGTVRGKYIELLTNIEELNRSNIKGVSDDYLTEPMLNIVLEGINDKSIFIKPIKIQRKYSAMVDVRDLCEWLWKRYLVR